MPTWDITAWDDEIPKLDFDDDLNLLIAQYSDRPRMLAMLDCLLTCDELTDPRGLQAAEDVAYQMLALRSVYTATGVNLELVGSLVGQERPGIAGADDEVYRLWILVRIMVNRSNGRWSELLDILERIGITEHIDAIEMHGGHYAYAGPAFRTCVFGVDATQIQSIWELVQLAGGAGCQWDFCWTTYDEADAFTLASTPGADEASTTQGLSNVAGTTGGYLVRMMR